VHQVRGVRSPRVRRIRAHLKTVPHNPQRQPGELVRPAPPDILLTGAFTAERAGRLEPGDWRADDPDFAGPALSRNLALAAALRPVAERHGVTPAAVAIAWTLSFPGVTGAIVGARRTEQVDGWVPAATLELKDDDLADIASAIRATGAGTGPTSPSSFFAAPRRQQGANWEQPEVQPRVS
jgi:hypothetical protein